MGRDTRPPREEGVDTRHPREEGIMTMYMHHSIHRLIYRASSFRGRALATQPESRREFVVAKSS